jgi:hypothetical protein
VEHHTSLHNTVMVAGKPMMRHPSLLEMNGEEELVPANDGEGRSNWRKLAETVTSVGSTKPAGTSFLDIVKHASLARIVEILNLLPFKRRTEHIKWVTMDVVS